MRFFIVFLSLITVFCQGALAQIENVGTMPEELSYQNKTLSVGMGSINALDTYLSPNTYRGTALFLLTDVTKKAMLRNREAYFNSLFVFNISSMSDNSNRGQEFSFMFDYRYSLNFEIVEDNNFSLYAGPETVMKIGSIYNIRNSNNPIQAKLHLAIAVTSQAVYRFKVVDYPLAMRYRIDLPLLGTIFSPEYGQLYYEMFEYNQFSKAFVLAWPGNTPSCSQFISLDLPVKDIQIRVTFFGDYFKYKVNGLKSSIFTNTFMIGVSKKMEFLYNGR